MTSLITKLQLLFSIDSILVLIINHQIQISILHLAAFLYFNDIRVPISLLNIIFQAARIYFQCS